jgi:hypothetical protein
MKEKIHFFKKNDTDKVWWVADQDPMPWGRVLFSFDKKKIYNLYADYPWNLTKEEKELFDKENPILKMLLRGRTE